MDDPERNQGEVDEEEGVDRISNLEEPIRAKILSYLPIKDAIRTSRLSSKWRYTWTVIPEFDIREAHFPSRKWQDVRSRMVKFVDNLFLTHKGPIRNFRLLTKKCYFDALDRWILHLSRNGISELTLELTSKRKYKIHSSFFACKGLSSINLCNCLIKLPQYFEGFEVLSVLKLDNCSLKGSEIERFVQNCPLLKELSLRKFRERSSLRIDAPHLERLSIVGNFKDLQLFTPRLAKACIDLEKNPYAEGSWPKGGSRSNFLRAFWGALCIRVLGMHRYFLQYLAQGNCLEENQVSTIFSQLKALTLDIDLSNSEIRAASVLFLNAPTLEDLDIIISNSSKEKCCPISVSEVFCLKNLKNVSIECISLCELTVSFLQAILRSSPLLETLTISTDKADYDNQAAVNKLYKSPRASKVIINHL